jgi:hypothetical protein
LILTKNFMEPFKYPIFAPHLSFLWDVVPQDA